MGSMGWPSFVSRWVEQNVVSKLTSNMWIESIIRGA
jgi:hypothetical protein